MICKYCGGFISLKQNFRKHIELEENEFLRGEEGKDYVTCKECGLRAKSIKRHVRVHMSYDEYMRKYDNPLTVCETFRKKVSKTLSEANTLSLGKHKDDKPCPFCGEIVNHRTDQFWNHLQECPQTIKKMKLNYDFILCPICQRKMALLSNHLRREHGWSSRQIAEAKLEGLKVVADKVAERRAKTNRRKYGTDHHFQNKQIQEKRRKTFQEHLGVDNPFQAEEVKEKIRRTNRERYGVDHPMQSEEIFRKQQESAQYGPSE